MRIKHLFSNVVVACLLYRDEGVSFPIQKGVEASRSSVRYFKHNDMADLERLLEEQAVEDKKVIIYLCVIILAPSIT